MKIAVYDLESWEKERFRELQEEHDVFLSEESLTAENASQQADAEAISTFIDSDLSRDTLEKFDHLKLIATRSTGYDHVAGDFCREQKITVANVPSYGKNTVAEHAFGLLLTLSHRLVEAIDRTRKGDFSSRGLQGFDLMGKTFGVVGTGDIGRHAIQIAKGFGMRVLAYDVKPDPQAAGELGFEYVSLEDLLGQSDVVSLHVPASPQTEHLIGQAQFEQMKDGAVLLNTARGSVVENRALVRAIAEGKLAGAGLDVLPEEPVIREEAELLRSVYGKQHDLETLLADQVLVRLQNVVVTPHSAFNTTEAVNRILDTTIENLRSFAAGQAQNTVELS